MKERIVRATDGTIETTESPAKVTERIPNDERSGKVTERIIRATDGTIEVTERIVRATDGTIETTESPAKATERIPNDRRSSRSEGKNRQNDGWNH
ncbi:hypothetical protein CWD94_14010 [Lysinibacillus xylanilyticus]|uniref:Uncharacterized protein n=1 Tax=Lysinibacillus xylanilyticus TaxID=582475 RepID=A0A2M9Q494_9BACI|nr:hypothetical protein CWD94_14010 [Lysinibacillus xylanilyticus]